MLLSLHVENILLAQKLDISFDDKMTVFTGETGSGKSIFINSLLISLGEKVSESLIRKGSNSASITSIFELYTDHPVWKILDEAGITYEDNKLILKRILKFDQNQNFKHLIFINNQPSTIKIAKSISPLILDIHQQLNQQFLLDSKNHLDILDEFAIKNLDDIDLSTAKVKFRTTYNEFIAVKKIEEEFLEQVRRDAEDKDFILDSLEKIKTVNPLKGEVEELAVKRKELMIAKRQIEKIAEISSVFKESDPVDKINRARKLLAMIDPVEKELLEKIKSFDDAVETIFVMRDIIEDKLFLAGASDKELDTIEERLFLLKAESRRHNIIAEDLHLLYGELQEKESKFDNYETMIVEHRSNTEKAENLMKVQSKNLSEMRVYASKLLQKSIQRELADVRLEKANFIVHHEDKLITSNGGDHIIFRASTNPGMPVGDLNLIASGGELARFILAMKVILVSISPVSLMVFDEIDQGISGAVANAIGKRLKLLADTKQVFAITHSPLVARWGDNHFQVHKTQEVDITTLTVSKLSITDRVGAIAKLISDDNVTEEATETAKKLLQIDEL
ncbi:MAG: hypothetical protein JJV96_00425 [Alphaproteobacteria bacterium]|nr:hypothetical protein [Alphaproteobacteria bacterium]